MNTLYYNNIKKFGFIKTSIIERINYKVERMKAMEGYRKFKFS